MLPRAKPFLRILFRNALPKSNSLYPAIDLYCTIARAAGTESIRRRSGILASLSIPAQRWICQEAILSEPFTVVSPVITAATCT